MEILQKLIRTYFSYRKTRKILNVAQIIKMGTGCLKSYFIFTFEMIFAFTTIVSLEHR